MDHYSARFGKASSPHYDQIFGFFLKITDIYTLGLSKNKFWIRKNRLLESTFIVYLLNLV